MELIEDYNDKTETIFAMGQEGDEQNIRNDDDEDNSTSLVMNAPVSPSAEPRIRENTAENYNGGVYNESNERAPFLFLDVREKPEYNQCHLKCARNYPANNLKHDKVSPELYFYKNRNGYVIVIYDLNDRMARNVATMFTEKGYENIFLLTGGLERFAALHPDLVTDVLPEPNEGKENKSRTKRGKIGGNKEKKGVGGRQQSSGKGTTEYTEIGGIMSFANNAKNVPKNKGGRPPRAPRNTRNSGAATGGGNNQLTTENVKANERACGTPGKNRTPSKHGGRSRRAPSQAGSTVSRADTLLSWNAGGRGDMQTSL